MTCEDGTKIHVKDLKKGEMIQSIKDGKKFYDKVIEVSIFEGKFQAHKFVFSNGKTITVTSPHLMMIWKGSEMVMTAARDVKMHDLMCFENDKFAKVTEILDITLDRKVNVNTLGGMMYANGVLTTGMCEKPAMDLPAPAKDVLENYIKTHQVYACGVNNYLLKINK